MTPWYLLDDVYTSRDEGVGWSFEIFIASGTVSTEVREEKKNRSHTETTGFETPSPLSWEKVPFYSTFDNLLPIMHHYEAEKEYFSAI